MTDGGEGGEHAVGPTEPGFPWTPSTLTGIRGRRRWRGIALLVGVSVGLGAAWVHWLGLFVAGALVGLPSRTLARAVLAGVAFGALVAVVQVLAVPGMGASEFLGFRPPVYVTLGAALGAPAWGSLIRGVV
ncbi:MAG: hypothetical protein ABEH88_00315 [Halobacteriales archaeon]